MFWNSEEEYHSHILYSSLVLHVLTALRTDLFTEPSHKTPGQGAAYPAGRWGWGSRCTRTKDNKGPNSDFLRKDSALGGCFGTFFEFHQPFLIISCLVLFFCFTFYQIGIFLDLATYILSHILKCIHFQREITTFWRKVFWILITFSFCKD